MENVSPILTAKNLNLWYGDFKALKDISLDMGEREITALIGPSGCGKSTFLKTLNRMNDLVPGVRIEVDAALDLLMVIKYLERIGDHAVNLAEWVEFVRTGCYHNETLF